MPKKCFTPEQIVTNLKQVEMLLLQGKQILLACREAVFLIRATTVGARNLVG